MSISRLICRPVSEKRPLKFYPLILNGGGGRNFQPPPPFFIKACIYLYLRAFFLPNIYAFSPAGLRKMPFSCAKFISGI
jgi:hypothetical protein